MSFVNVRLFISFVNVCRSPGKTRTPLALDELDELELIELSDELDDDNDVDDELLDVETEVELDELD